MEYHPVKHDLATTKYTRVYSESVFTNHAPHNFIVTTPLVVGESERLDKQLLEVPFQNGAIKENGVNGVMNEDLIHMVICRLEHFQGSPFACRENQLAITKLEEALLWLRKRTIGRENRGVEGTTNV